MPYVPSNPGLGTLEKLPTELRQDILSRAGEGDLRAFTALQRTSRPMARDLLNAPTIKNKRKEAALVAESLDYNCACSKGRLSVEAKMTNLLMFLNKEDVPEGKTRWRNDFTKAVRTALSDIEDLEHNQGRKVREKDLVEEYKGLRMFLGSRKNLTDKQIIEKTMKEKNIKKSDPYIESSSEIEKRCKEILDENFGMLFNNPDHYQFPSCLKNLKQSVIQSYLRHSSSITYQALIGLTSDPSALSEDDCEALARMTLQQNKDYDNKNQQGDGWSNDKSDITSKFSCVGDIIHKLTPETKKELVNYALSPASYNALGTYESHMIGGLARGACYLDIDDHQKLLMASEKFVEKVDDEQVDTNVFFHLLSNLALGCKNLPPDRQHMKDLVFDMIEKFYDINPQQIFLELEGFSHLESLVSIYPDLNHRQRNWIKDTIKTLDHLPEPELDSDGDVIDPLREYDPGLYDSFGREICLDKLKFYFVKNFSAALQDMKRDCPQDIDDVFDVFSSVGDDCFFLSTADMFSNSGLDCLTRKQFENVKERLGAIKSGPIPNIDMITAVEKVLRSYIIGEKMMEVQRKSFRPETNQ